jgi:predicted nuclease of restriction endonuclease-like RecB superfamily
MLTAELVRATRRNGQLHLTPLAGKQRVRALELAESKETKLAAGLNKLVEDACEFEAESEIDPRELRADVFTRAAELRRNPTGETRFDRQLVLERSGAAHGWTPEQVERALFSDLKSEHRLLKPPALSAAQLLERYDLAQLQAVLLRAVKVSARVRCASPDGYRDLFRKLKFRRLMFQIRRAEGGAYDLEIDGPFSLFESVTKYGLQLALMLPALLAAEELELKADLRWGKARQPLEFALSRRSGQTDGEGRARLPDETEDLLAAFGEGKEGWKAAPAEEVLDLPGVGLCVPDLRFSHYGGTTVFLEVLGYWSREAVWKRIELVQKGLPQKLLFAASQRLRVSEAALEDHPSGALYVYKGSLSAKAVLEHLERLRGSRRTV